MASLIRLTLLCLVATGAANAADQNIDQHRNQSIKELPKKMRCEALQTAGLHDYAGAPESYEPSTFFESKFELRINSVLTRHLAPKGPSSEKGIGKAIGKGVTEETPDLYLTMRPTDLVSKDKGPIELRCRQVKGQGGTFGYSCTNTPPSELLLINPENLRFTRASIGGWTFADTAPDHSSPAASLDFASDEESKAGEPTSHLGDDSLFVEHGHCL